MWTLESELGSTIGTSNMKPRGHMHLRIAVNETFVDGKVLKKCQRLMALYDLTFLQSSGIINPSCFELPNL